LTFPDRQAIETYLRRRFGPDTRLLALGLIGQESAGGKLKGYGYGRPLAVTFRQGKTTRRAVLETMSPGPFGHEHLADRAQALLWDYDS
jgi:hypothetical protein